MEQERIPVTAELVTGYLGQILDECEIDEHAHELIMELYEIAAIELNNW